MLIGSPW